MKPLRPTHATHIRFHVAARPSSSGLRTWRSVLTWAVFVPVLAACGGPEVEPHDEEDARAARGGQLLAQYHCGSCHAIPGVPASQGQLAASLAAYGQRSYIAGRVANEPAMMARWIVDPASVAPGTLMPNMGVSPDDARSMALYLSRLR